MHEHTDLCVNSELGRAVHVLLIFDDILVLENLDLKFLEFAVLFSCAVPYSYRDGLRGAGKEPKAKETAGLAASSKPSSIISPSKAQANEKPLTPKRASAQSA